MDVSSTAAPELVSTEPDPPTTITVVDTAALAELAALLADSTVRAWALAPTQGDNQAIQVGSGNADQLVRRARLGTEAATWAIVAQPRPELVALDIDECAELVVPEIRQAAADTATVVVAAVASGRDDCLHLWCIPATRHGRDELLRRVALIREHHRLPAAAIDHREGKAIRLPGSVSLKPEGRPAQLVDLETGKATDVRTVIRAVQASLPRDARGSAPQRLRRRQPAPSAIPLPLPVDDGTRLVTEAPRAWRRRAQFTPEDWAILNDDTRRDRSAAATDAAWVLWRHGIRSATAAMWWYQRTAAFGKFRQRDEVSRRDDRTSDWSACRQHWASIARRARAFRPEIPESDRRTLDAAREEIRWWGDADLQAAAAVVIDRFSDGYGLASRPIARRDLQLALHLSDGAASDRLAALVKRGLLVVSHPWSSTTPREATRYDLAVPATTYRGETDHDVTSPAVPLQHPLWGLLRHTSRRTLLTLLRHPASPTRQLAALLGLPPGDATHGVLHLLRQLEDAGLATRAGTGRGTLWSAASTLDLDAASRRTGALTRAQELAARICGERACWHAESHAETARTLRGLHVLRARLTHAEARGQRPRPHPAPRHRTHPRPPRRAAPRGRHSPPVGPTAATPARERRPSHAPRSAPPP